MVDVLPFAGEHLDDAGRLLAERQRAQRAAEPALAARFEDAATARAEVEALWHADGVSGVIGVSDGRVTGFLLGAPRDRTWGPNVWIEVAGHAVEEAETVRDLYAAAAARWVEEGRTSHYAVVPAADAALVDAWFRLGFGQQHVHALREVPSAPESTLPEGVSIRRATREDIPDLARMDVLLPQHQALSPVFSSYPPPTLEEARADWEQDFGEERFATFVAVVDGRIVGSAIGCALEESSAHKGTASVDHAGFLGFAAVEPEARGRGVGTALTEAVFAWAHEAGYPVIVTDWRATNLLSSRMWPPRGFRPTFLRLYRSIP